MITNVYINFKTVTLSKLYLSNVIYYNTIYKPIIIKNYY